jgi:hypothetical protein
LCGCPILPHPPSVAKAAIFSGLVVLALLTASWICIGRGILDGYGKSEWGLITQEAIVALGVSMFVGLMVFSYMMGWGGDD